MGRATRLRFGRFYTPAHVADLALDEVLRGNSDLVWDPTCGDGAFLRRAAERGHDPSCLHGDDIDAAAIAAAADALPDATLQVGDLFTRTEGSFDAIVGNPPFVRVERLPADRRTTLRETVTAAIGFEPPAQTDLSVLALLQALRFLAPGGRLAFVMPNTWMDASYGRPVRQWLLERYRLVAVLESRDEPWFPEAAVNTVIVVFQNSPGGGTARFGDRVAIPPEGRWGPMLRAPDLWFDVTAAAPLVRTGDVLDLSYGTKVGVAAFFTPRGGLGDVEAASRRPFIRSLRGLHRYAVEPDDVDGELFVPTDPPGPRATAWIERGAASATRAGVPWPEVPSLRNNLPWYRLRGLRGGDVIVPQFRSERHYALANPHRILVNNSAWHGTFRDPRHAEVGVALMNSTWAALAAEVGGRTNLGEGLLTCYGPDLDDLPIPDPERFVGTPAGDRLLEAWGRLRTRAVLPLRDEVTRGDRRDLDDAVCAGLGLPRSFAARIQREAVRLCTTRSRLAAALRKAR